MWVFNNRKREATVTVVSSKDERKSDNQGYEYLEYEIKGRFQVSIEEIKFQRIGNRFQ